MDNNEVKKRVKSALGKFNREKEYLYRVDIYEPTLCHRIALYLEEEFQNDGYVVDCEYNKNITDPKRDDSGMKIRPDIIVHKRNSPDDNLLFIEVKKGSRSTRGAKEDIKKLHRINNLSYSNGLFLGVLKERIDFVWVNVSGTTHGESI